MSQRANQVAEELRKIISMIFVEDISDPHIGFITITRIEITDDLRFARVYYSVLGDEQQREDTAQALAANYSHIKRMTVERINMRYAMDLRFEFDKSIEGIVNIEKIFKKIKETEPEEEEDSEKEENDKKEEE